MVFFVVRLFIMAPYSTGFTFRPKFGKITRYIKIKTKTMPEPIKLDTVLGKTDTAAKVAAPAEIAKVAPASKVVPAASNLSFFEKAKGFLDKAKSNEAVKVDAAKAADAKAKTDSSPLANIFTQSAPKAKEAKMVTTVISQKDTVQKVKSILGPAPTLEKSLEVEKELRMRQKLRFRQFLLVFLFVAGVAMSFYFYAELSPSFDLFGSNTTSRLTDVNSSLRTTQTDLNKYRYLAAQLNLNEFSYQSDKFLSSVAKLNNAAVANKADLEAKVNDAKNALPILLQNIKNALTEDIAVVTYKTAAEPELTDEEIHQQFADDLRAALLEDRKAIPQDSTNAEDILDLKSYNDTLKLVGNEALFTVLKDVSVDNFKQNLDDYQTSFDPIKLKNIQDLVSKIFASTKSDLAVITDVKHNRVEWSSIINQIETETLNIDTHYGQPLLYQSFGGIVYTGYEFDTNTNKIVLSGSTKTIDGSNFTLMSNLIDQLENSVYFKNVQMRSFSKNKAGTGSSEGYLANFKIDLNLETGDFSSKNQPLSLKSNLLPDGIKRDDTAVIPVTQQLTQQTQQVQPKKVLKTK